jgi:flagellar motor switch protein FliN
MMTEPIDSEAPKALASSFFEAFLKAISESGVSIWKVNANPLQSPTRAGSVDCVLLRLTLAGSLQGDLLMEFDRVEAAALGLKPDGEAKGSDAQSSESLIQLVNKQKSRICSELLPAYGVFTIETSIAKEPPSDSASDTSDGIHVVGSDDAGNALHVIVHPSVALRKSLVPQINQPNLATSTLDTTQCGSEQVNLELVLDVELNVTVRFGQRQLTLREVLDLTSGSVIELDRQVEEPVELLLDGKVIARGEAVVIDGNYGLRITEVPRSMSPTLLS